MQLPTKRAALAIVADAAVITAVAAALALATNAVRRDGLPLVAQKPYAVLVPCPDVKGEAEAISPGDPRLANALLVDARAPAEYAAWHAPNALNVTYDWIDAVSPEAIQKLKLASVGAKGLAVYGDGADPDTGRELARELAGKGIRNVFYVQGGAPALREAQR